MKIIYLSTASIPSRSANSVHIMKMCAAFATNGHDVTLFAPRIKNMEKGGENVYQFYGVPKNFTIKQVIYPSFSFGLYFYAFLTIITLLFKKSDLIFSRNLLCSSFAAVLRRPQILEIHQPIPKNSRIQNRLFKMLIRLKSFKQLVVITKPLKKIYIENYRISEQLIHVAADGADLPLRSLNSNVNRPERLQVGYVGHLYEGRGVELILDLANQCLWADFYIVGGNEGDIKRIKKLSQYHNNLKILGFITPAKAEKFRESMDVLLSPYQEKVGLGSGSITTETWMSPLKIFEYMAAGKAIISSDLPVLHEVLEHKKNCILCSPTDTSEWKIALEFLNNDEFYRQKLARQASEDLTNKYTWQIRAKQILDNIMK